MATLWTKVDSPALGSGSTASRLQDSLWWYMAFAAVLSVVIAGGRMAWEARAEAGRELIKSLMTLVLVTGAGLTGIKLALEAGDGFSDWMIGDSVKDNKFGERMTKMLVAVTATTGGLGTMLIILVGIVVILASLAQILLMIARSAMLVLLAGILPLSASATNTTWGRQWFHKTAGWLIAFILYKPAAAIVYAAAFEMFGTETGLMGALMAMSMMVLAIFALPALMRLCVPLVGGLAGSSGGGMGSMSSAAMMASSAAGGPTGATETPAPSGGGAQSSGPSGSGISGGSGPTAGGTSASAGSAGGGVVSGGEAAAAGTGVGAVAVLGAEAVKSGFEAVKQSADDATGEGGPDGSQ
jgi:type IV secretion system protein TrbL